MRIIAASIILLALLAQNFSRYLVVLQYDLNKNYIAQNLCENRNKPKCCCNGKCFLKKQLAKNDKEENSSNSNSKKDKSEVLLFAQERKQFNSNHLIDISSKHFLCNSYFIPQHFYGTVFHPPQA